MKAKQCGQVGPRGGECKRRQYTGMRFIQSEPGFRYPRRPTPPHMMKHDFCWKHSEQVRRGVKLFCRICNQIVDRS